MQLEGLSLVCAGIECALVDEKNVPQGYDRRTYCLENLKDLQRFLRRDDPQTRDVFKLVSKWNIASNHLIPIIEHYQGDCELVINAVKVMVFLTMPIDPTSDDISGQMEYLWNIKVAVTRNDAIAVIVSLLEDPLEHLECEAFSEDDWKLVQLVLTLFRNLLSIHEISPQQQASGCTNQFLCLRDGFLEILFSENVMDLILVLTQHITDFHGYIHQDKLLLLEIYHYIFLHQKPQLVAKVSQKNQSKGETSPSSFRSIKEEEEKRRVTRSKNLIRHSLFSGTFVRLAVDGSKMLIKGNPVTVPVETLLEAHKVPRGPLKRIICDNGSSSASNENVLWLLHNFANQFLSRGYNVLMESIREDIEKEHHAIQNSDVVIFFQVVQFLMAFQRHKYANSKVMMKATPSKNLPISHAADAREFYGDICGPIAATMNEAMFALVMSKWHYSFDGVKETNNWKFLAVTGSLMKEMSGHHDCQCVRAAIIIHGRYHLMEQPGILLYLAPIRVLDLILKLFPEDYAKESQTARILLYKIFYDQTDQGITHFLLNLIRGFDTHKQPKSDLADLVEMVHYVLCLMENLQARGCLRVSKKARKQTMKRKLANKESRKNEGLMKEHAELPSASGDMNPEIRESILDPLINVADPNDESLSSIISDGIKVNGSMPSPTGDHGVVLPTTEQPANDLAKDGAQICSDVPNHQTCGIDGYSEDDTLDDMVEVDLEVPKLVATFADNTVVQNLCWLLKFYRSNSLSTNHYIICLLRRISDDLELFPMFFQLSLLCIFYDILVEQQTSGSKDHKNIVSFLTKLVTKLFMKLKSRPLLFVEILFWKTRKECNDINAEFLSHEIENLMKEVNKWRNVSIDGENTNEEAGPVIGGERSYRKRVADCLGEDEMDFEISKGIKHPYEGGLQEEFKRSNDQDGPSWKNLEFTSVDQIADDLIYNEGKKSSEHGGVPKRRKRLVFDNDKEDIIRDVYENHPRKRIHAFSKEQELMITYLFEQFKEHKKCSHLIATALNDKGMYSASQISRKLRQLGLCVPQRKGPSRGAQPSVHEPVKDVDAVDRELESEEETLAAIRNRSRRKNNNNRKHVQVEGAKTAGVEGRNKIGFTEDFESDDETLKTILEKKSNNNRKHVQVEGAITAEVQGRSKIGFTGDSDSNDETLKTILERKNNNNRKHVQVEGAITAEVQGRSKIGFTKDSESEDETLKTILEKKIRRSSKKVKNDHLSLVQVPVTVTHSNISGASQHAVDWDIHAKEDDELKLASFGRQDIQRIKSQYQLTGNEVMMDGMAAMEKAKDMAVGEMESSLLASSQLLPDDNMVDDLGIEDDNVETVVSDVRPKRKMIIYDDDDAE
ncbi:uncharacterized protein LOC18433200 isoform X1 [Amborella trichopoda]|uniref:uncharacterized protein LOC18433200 isoform X1 n=1 Tax=Amborella trichopoda TaxID=13333 RepID=UPI0009C1520B|nr:uncharacterized protein LOC18433200 isoform X1 [Amborella trichopoda]XP_020522241.1 uncharacterized protein LOC18433200 isoform X1 [Amborella trichopoda]|eukprot:XP_020522240.1 uncharacterized protein LOC18433200 isoform X1 [Amborella trichopoda]